MNKHGRIRRLMPVALAITLLPLTAVAQAARLRMPDFSDLSSKATRSVDIDLDRDTLKSALGFMTGPKADPDLVEAIKGLESVTVKVFSFDKPGAYSTRDIERLVRQVESGGWKKMMSVREPDNRVEMWMHEGTGPDGGLFFVASEPRQLVLINIAGKVDLATLAKLQGRIGMPNLGLGGPPAPPAPPAPPSPPAASAPPAPAAPPGPHR